MRAMNSFAILFSLLMVTMAYAQETTTVGASTTMAAASEAGATTAATDPVQNDAPAGDAKTSEASTPSVDVTSPPLLHESGGSNAPTETEDKQSTDSKTTATTKTDAGTTKTEGTSKTDGTTKAGSSETTAPPKDGGNSSASITSSIVCLFLSVLPIFMYQS